MYPNHFFQKHFSKLTHCLGFLLCILVYSNLEAQTPGLSYQALVYDDDNKAVASQSIQLKFTIKDNTSSILYSETITETTDTHGMVAVSIGTALNKANAFLALSWDGTPKTLKVEVSTDSGLNFHDLSEDDILYLPQASSSSDGQSSTFTNIDVSGTITDGNDSVGVNGDVMTTDGTKIIWKKPTLSWSIQEQTASSYTANKNDGTILAKPTSGNAITITLPAIDNDDNGTVISVVRSNNYLGSGDTLKIITSEPSPRTFNLNVGYQGLLFQAFGGEWRIIQKL
jgi:hypothetical protein